MGLFICAKCGCVENTALSTYWSRKRIKCCDELKEYEGKPLCSECGWFNSDMDMIIPGHWHGKFPKCQATDEEKRRMNSEGRI